MNLTWKDSSPLFLNGNNTLGTFVLWWRIMRLLCMASASNFDLVQLIFELEKFSFLRLVQTDSNDLQGQQSSCSICCCFNEWEMRSSDWRSPHLFGCGIAPLFLSWSINDPITKCSWFDSDLRNKNFLEYWFGYLYIF